MDKDQYSITLDAKRHLVHVVANGKLNREEGEEIITQALSTAAEHKYNIFCDVRKTEVKVTLADWFDMPRTLKIFNNEKTRLLKTAILISQGKQEEEYQFYETVSHNLGRSVRIFLTAKDAIEWLSAKK
jgi:hypothetical protein